MHIPDGYISPQTAGGLWAMMIPVWYAAGYHVKKALKARQAPLVAIGAAFVFVIMMFNVPVPGGTTGHVVGGTLVAVILGPWAAVIAISVALIIQALFFGDGGVLAIGANCFNIGFVLPVAGYYIYKLISAGASPSSVRRPLGAAIGAFVGLNVAALFTAVEIGIQPGLFHAADGTALYSPYDLSQAIPAMMLAHLTVIGLLESIMTYLVVLYLQRTNPVLLSGDKLPAAVQAPEGSRLKPLVSGIALLLVFVPLGLLATGTAWGEWSPEEVGEEVGFIPEGMDRFAGLWSGVLPDYALPGSEGAGFWSSVPGYIISGIAGLALVGGIAYMSFRLLSRRDGYNA